MGTTHVIQVIDGSGSMAPFRADVVGGFNTYVADLAHDQEQDYSVTAVVFSDKLEDIAQDAPPAKVKLDNATYAPSGSTALYYAIGTVITEFRDRWRGKAGPDDKVLFVVNTDGQENYSHAFRNRQGEPVWTREKVAALMREVEAAGWLTLYIGAAPEAWNAHEGMGFTSGVNTRVEKTGETYSVLSKATQMTSRGLHTNGTFADHVDEAVGER